MGETIASAATGEGAVATGQSVLAQIKARQQATWAAGDYAVIGTTLQLVGESLCEAVDLRAGSHVLDVAAVNGNTSLAAARRWCHVTSTDYVPALLHDGERRARADRLAVRFMEADAEHLPFDDASFDVVLSSFGVMFTPDHVTAADEMLRVCRPGGTIGLANWTPRGFIGRLFGVIGRHVPPPPGLAPASRWGTEEYLRQLFGHGASRLHVTPRVFTFRYRSADHWLEVFRTWYGPIQRAFGALDDEGRLRLEADIRTLIAEFNTADDGTIVVPGEYIEAVIVRR